MTAQIWPWAGSHLGSDWTWLRNVSTSHYFGSRGRIPEALNAMYPRPPKLQLIKLHFEIESNCVKIFFLFKIFNEKIFRNSFFV